MSGAMSMLFLAATMFALWQQPEPRLKITEPETVGVASASYAISYNNALGIVVALKCATGAKIYGNGVCDRYDRIIVGVGASDTFQVCAEQACVDAKVFRAFVKERAK